MATPKDALTANLSGRKRYPRADSAQGELHLDCCALGRFERTLHAAAAERRVLAAEEQSLMRLGELVRELCHLTGLESGPHARRERIGGPGAHLQP